MTSELDAMGAAVEGVLVGAAVEHEQIADGQAEWDGEKQCLNCKTMLAGPFCKQCGQKAQIHRTTGAIVHDILHGVLHFDGKIWRTIPMLFWYPGQLTRRYVDGERAKFVSPLALFLFSVFLTYAAFSLLGTGANFDVGQKTWSAAQEELSISSEEAEVKIAEIKANIAKDIAAGKTVSAQQEELDALEKRLALTQDFLSAGRKNGNLDISKLDLDGIDPAIVNLVKNGIESPNLILYKVQANAYKFAWLLILFSAPFLWLLFPFSKRWRMYDHFIFVTYSIAFVLLFTILLRVIGVVGLLSSGVLVFIAMVYIPIHMQRQLCGAYQLTWKGAILRTLALQLFALVSMLIFAVLLLGIAGS